MSNSVGIVRSGIVPSELVVAERGRVGPEAIRSTSSAASLTQLPLDALPRGAQLLREGLRPGAGLVRRVADVCGTQLVVAERRRHRSQLCAERRL